MKTKITQKEIIRALKIRMNSVAIENRFATELLMDGIEEFSPAQYARVVKRFIIDLEHLVNLLK